MQRETKNINDIALEFSGGKTLDQLRESQNRQSNASQIGNSEAIAAYWEKVFSGKKMQRVTMVAPLVQQVDYETARVEFRELIKDRAVEIAVAKNLSEYKIELTPDQGMVVVALLKWLINDPTGPLDIAKGFWLYGQPGTFKTELVKLLQRYAVQRELFKQFQFTDWSLEYDIALMDGKSDMIQVNEQQFRCFDEFGRKAMPINRFGNKVDANESIIESRYQRFKRYRQFTMFVSNYDPNAIKEILSPMAFDRLTEMVQSIRMPGTSHRNAKPDHL